MKVHGLLPIQCKGKDSKKPSPRPKNTMRPIQTPSNPWGNLPRSRAPRQDPRQHPASLPRSRVASLPSSKWIDSASSKPPHDGKDKTAIRPPARRTEALNANHSAAAPGLDGVRLPLRTVVATRVLSANSGHCTAIPGAVAPLWELATHCANVRGAPPSAVLPTRTFHVLSLCRNPRTAWA